MIGQKNLLNRIDNMVTCGTLPHVILLVGAAGCGRKTMTKRIAEMLHTQLHFIFDNSVDSVRKMIEQCNVIHDRAVFVVDNVDNMSPSARNSLLKVTEEPPNDAYIILIVENTDNVLDTIKSRAHTLFMDYYTLDELSTFIPDNVVRDDRVLQTCITPVDVKTVYSYNVKEFFDFVNLVIDNIAKVSGSNAFKIADKISFSDGDGKYDLRIFWKAIAEEYLIRFFKLSDDRYAKSSLITIKYINDLSVNGINRSATFDMWILAIRKEFL